VVTEALGARSGERPALLAGLVALGVLVALDVGVGNHADFAAAVVVAPVLTAALGAPPTVLAVAAASLAVSLALNGYDDAGIVATSVRTVVVIVGSATAVWVSHRRQVSASRLGRVSHIAEVAQSALLDPVPDRIGPARFAGWYISATEEALVGGDFYHAVGYKDRVRWMVGDVSGKGIDAVRTAAAAIGAFREAGDSLATLTEVVARVDHRVTQYVSEEGFATAVFAELGADGQICIVNCGHPPPLRLTAGAPQVMTALPPTIPLGLGPTPREDYFRLSTGDCLWFLTDGVLEARAQDGTRGLDAEALAWGTGARGVEAASVLFDRMRRATGAHLGDDSAALIVEYRPEDG
jgi:sigma-B regulation protein RsbU (phosphoserine phosphatase)